MGKADRFGPAFFMNTVTTPKFVHHQNLDGTIDSVCQECLLTVAKRYFEVDLERAEQDHLDDSWCGAGNTRNHPERS
jgi:hypothetical protein